MIERLRQREAVALAGANRKRLNDPRGAKARSEPFELFLVHVGPGVEPSSTSIFEMGTQGVFRSLI